MMDRQADGQQCPHALLISATLKEDIRVGQE